MFSVSYIEGREAGKSCCWYSFFQVCMWNCFI